MRRGRAPGLIFSWIGGDGTPWREHLRRDPGLLARRFALPEIRPPELGCASAGRVGRHGTPIAGTTLLPLAIDVQEHEIFDWRLAQGADVHACAAVDRDGFGNHTPLFHAAVNGTQRDTTMARALLAGGVDADLRVHLRKFLDGRETPAGHEARERRRPVSIRYGSGRTEYVSFRASIQTPSRSCWETRSTSLPSSS